MLNWRTSVLGQPSPCPKTGLQNEPKRLGKWAKIGTTNWTPYLLIQWTLIMQLDAPTYSYVLQEIVNLNDVPTFEIPIKGKVISQDEFNKLEAEMIKSRGTEAGKVRIIRM